VRLVGEAGWASLTQAVRNAATGGRPHAAAVDEALQRLERRQVAAAWSGVWVDEGLDVLEVGEPRERAWIAIDEGRWTQKGRGAAFTVGGGTGRVGKSAVRMVWAPRVGAHEGRVAALQRDGRTWWRMEGKDLVGFVDDWLPRFTDADAPVLARVAAWREAVEGTLATRARAIVAWRSGDPAAAVKLLEELAAHKKPRPDVYYWLGRAYADAKKKKQAKDALGQFLDKAGKKADFRKEAEALLAELK
jgi:hypothetical protein